MFLSPYYRALADVALPTQVDALTPSHIAAILGWDQQAAVRLVPMTDEQAGGPAPAMRSGTGERRLRRVE